MFMPAVAMAIGSGDRMTGVGEHLAMVTLLVSSTTGCPRCPLSWSLGVGRLTGSPSLLP